MLIWRGGWTGEGRLGIELSGSILFEGLELIVWVMVESILNKRCVSLPAASNVGCAAGRAPLAKGKRAAFASCTHL